MKVVIHSFISIFFLIVMSIPVSAVPQEYAEPIHVSYPSSLVVPSSGNLEFEIRINADVYWGTGYRIKGNNWIKVSIPGQSIRITNWKRGPKTVTVSIPVQDLLNQESIIFIFFACDRTAAGWFCSKDSQGRRAWEYIEIQLVRSTSQNPVLSDLQADKTSAEQGSNVTFLSAGYSPDGRNVRLVCRIHGIGTICMSAPVQSNPSCTRIVPQDFTEGMYNVSCFLMDSEGMKSNMKTVIMNVFVESAETTNLDLTLNEIIDAAHEVANSMEGNRLLPDSVNLGLYNLSIPEYLQVAVKGLLLLNNNVDIASKHKFTIREINQPTNPYPNADLLSNENQGLYTNPLGKFQYIQLAKIVNQSLASGSEAPGTVNYNEADVRYPELVYLFSSILRFYSFYSHLPQFYSLHIISPKGLVPWMVPTGFEGYTTAIYRWGTDDLRYYGSGAHYYEIFKLAKEIVGTETDTYKAGELIYNWSKYTAWGQVGYFALTKQFEEIYSSPEWIRLRRGTSGTPRLSMRALMRTLNLPVSGGGDALYINGNGWINIDVHALYGSDPSKNTFVYEFPPGPVEDYNPDTYEVFVQKIKSIISLQGTSKPGKRAIFINPGDVEKYGARKIANDASKGGFNIIILTVKTALGHFYYNSTLANENLPSGFPNPIVADYLQPIINEAHSKNIKVYAALSVLYDKYLMVRKSGSSNPNDLNLFYREWAQPVGFNKYLISPCIQEYKEMVKRYLSEITSGYDVDGVVLGYLYFEPYSTPLNDEYTACQSYESDTNWRENLLTSYARELINVIYAHCPECKVKILSFPILSAASLDDETRRHTGYQNVFELNKVGDGIIIPLRGNSWLLSYQTQIPAIINKIKSSSGVSPSLSFYITDEWTYSPEFYSGLMTYAAENDVNFFSLHDVNSLDGEYGYAFTPSQYATIENIG